MPRLLRFATVLTTVILLTTHAAAHDFWLAPSSGHARPGDTVNLTINVGEHYPVADSFVAPERVELVQLIGPGGTLTPVMPTFSREAEALVTPVTLPAGPGIYIAHARLKARFIELAAKEFTAYLKDEGLTRVIQERQRRGESGKPGRERYSRWPKALIRAGEADMRHVTTPVGLVSEIVPAVDPTMARVGDRLRFQLLFEGKPVACAQIAHIRGGRGSFASRRSKVVTDENGWASVVLREKGPQFVGTVHMVRRSAETGVEAADWESYWTSLTFEPAP